MYLAYPHTKKSRGVNSGDHGGHAIVPPPSAPVYDSMMTGRASKQLCASGMPSGGLEWKLENWEQLLKRT